MEYDIHTAADFPPTMSPISRACATDRLFQLTVALLVWLLILILLFPLRAAGDVALHTDNGGRLLDGQRLYIDFFNFNPPTIDYLNILPVAIGRFTGLHTILVYHLFIWLAVVAVSVGAGLMLMSARDSGRLVSLSAWLIPAAIAMSAHFAWILITFGQRDHIFILALMIWAILRWYRFEGGRPAPCAALLIGAFAATGASLKPMFALAFVLIEAYGLLRYRCWQAIFTWELLGASIIVGMFGAYFLLQPDILSVYLTEVAPSVVAGYKAYGYVPATELMFQEMPSLVLLSLSVVLLLMGTRLHSPLGRLYVVMSLLGLSALFSYSLQTKGWPYHALPIFATSLVIIGLCFDAATRRLGLLTLRRKSTFTDFILLAIALAFAVIGLVSGAVSSYGDVRNQETEQYLAYSQASDTVFVADLDHRAVYAALFRAGMKPVASYPIAYPLAFAYATVDDPTDAIYEADHTPPPIAQAYLDALIEDIREKQPQLVLLRVGPSDSGPQFIDVARFVKAHTNIEMLLAQEYESMGTLSPYEVYVRKSG
ncbi:MAG: hypothetical protein IT320_04565 [Anaerolineae bacterium]|nr:hypothetical protein [Anaerolineae bacterium]